MSDNKETPKAIFKAVTPDGHTYQVFDDGTSEGFPDSTILFNHWLALINFERGSQIRAANDKSGIALIGATGGAESSVVDAEHLQAAGIAILSFPDSD